MGPYSGRSSPRPPFSIVGETECALSLGGVRLWLDSLLLELSLSPGGPRRSSTPEVSECECVSCVWCVSSPFSGRSLMGAIGSASVSFFSVFTRVGMSPIGLSLGGILPIEQLARPTP